MTVFGSDDYLPRWVLGEFDDVHRRAKTYSSGLTWSRSQCAQAAGVMMAAAVPPPMIAVPAALAASVFTLRKMAHAAWGIGALSGAAVDPLVDLLAILELWIGRPRQDVLRIADTVRHNAPGVTTLIALEPVLSKFSPRLLETAAARMLRYRLPSGVPVAGALLAGGLTWYGVRSYGSCARDFYDQRRAA